jgi:hypothetical protein
MAGELQEGRYEKSVEGRGEIAGRVSCGAWGRTANFRFQMGAPLEDVEHGKK